MVASDEYDAGEFPELGLIETCSAVGPTAEGREMDRVMRHNVVLIGSWLL